MKRMVSNTHLHVPGLPIRANLQSRGVHVPLACVNCGGEIENNWHIFVSCQSLWRERNERLWNHTVRPANQIVRSSLKVLCDWLYAQNSATKRCSATAHSVACLRWHKPPQSFVKCNCDAAVFPESGEIGFGTLLRNEFSILIACRFLKLPGFPSVKEAKTLALHEAITWVHEFGFPRVVFEVDSKTVVDSYIFSLNDLTEFRSIIRDCRSLIENTKNFSLVHVQRPANEIGHILARRAQFVSGSVTLLETSY
ncbi:hypothetical protein DITRI_Ditri11bG0114200 [Diplodiscus trichospermus]